MNADADPAILEPRPPSDPGHGAVGFRPEVPHDRLTPLDASFLALVPQHLSIAVGVLDPRADGSVPGLDELRSFAASRLARSPRYRQRIAWVPHGLGRPVWMDDPEFSIDRHIVAVPGDEHSWLELGEVVGRLSVEPLDLAHPPWRIDLVPGLEDGGFGLVLRAHHALADGMAMLGFFGGLLADLGPEPMRDPPHDWSPEPPASDAVLAREAVLDAARGAATQIGSSARALATPARWRGAATASIGALAGTARVAGLVRRGASERVEPAAFNRMATRAAGASVALWSRPLDEMRDLEHRFGHPTTLNDVVLAATAGGLRRWLRETGQPLVDLRVLVPVDVLHDPDSHVANRASRIFVTLPVSEPDDARRVELVTRDFVTRRDRRDAETEASLETLVNRLPGPASRRASAWLSRTAWSFNLVVSDVIGPPVQLYCLGCPVRELYPLSSLAFEDGLVLTLTSMGDRLGFGLLAHGEAVPDPEPIVAGIQESLDGLKAVPL